MKYTKTKGLAQEHFDKLLRDTTESEFMFALAGFYGRLRAEITYLEQHKKDEVQTKLHKQK